MCYTAKSGKQIRIGLPGLSGPTLCDISTKFGKPETYPWNGGALSRWAYVEGVLKHCIENGTWSTLIKYLCSRPQFRDVLKDLDFEEAEEAYRQSITAAIDGINKILLFSGSQLVYQDGNFKVIASNRTALTGDEVLDSIFKQDKPNPFSSIQEYEQCEKLGEGGFGTVYRYHNSNLDMDFAVKIYHPWFVADDEREEGEKRFFREAKMLFSLNHPNIVRIYDAGRINGEPFIRMELIKGKSLDTFRNSLGNLKPVYALKAIRQILSGLECAHASGVIHRDLKPSNIMVGEDSPKYRCVIIDFGISAFMETEGYTRLTKTGEKIAGGQFIDPRLMENPKLRDPRSDIYSVGAILYFLLCGRAPVGSDMKEYLLNSNHDIDEEALALIMKSLASDLDDRYTSCADFINAIDNCLTSYKKV